MIKQPPHLKKGDQVAIVCPAKKLPRGIEDAIEVLKEWGLEVLVGETINASENQFAGNDELRTRDLQRYLDDPKVKAVIAARGGYGSIRIIDELDFTAFCQHPKWIVGFSDITVLLSHILELCNVMSIHGQMPYTFNEASPDSLESLRKALFGEPITYEYTSSFPNRAGSAEGVLIGGNLTILAMLEGSVSEMDYTDKILFLEDVGEQKYSIDRMMRMLKRSGKLASLRGLIVGAFNGVREEEIPFGQSPEEIIMDVVKDYDYPVCFNFPTGHIDDNRAMILGATIQLTVNSQKVELHQTTN
jgi:muramoyltetrapeptide carboxypeptidase